LPPHYNHFLPPESQRDRLDVVLVSPRNPLNIGAAARAMANFGFERLAVVAPYAPNWREARSAVGAPELLQNARESATLGEAVANCTLVAGTGTLTYRKPEQQVVKLPELAPLVRRELERGGRVGLVFGPEKHGLTREDLSYCHVLVEIPTDERQPSMNLGQAVAVCLYELAMRAFPLQEGAENEPAGDFPEAQQAAEKDLDAAEIAEKPPSEPEVNDNSADSAHGMKPAPRTNTGVSLASSGAAAGSAPAATSGNLERLAALVEKAMEAAGYSPARMRTANRHDLRLFLRKLGLTERDRRRILGLFRRILWRLQR
jgi:tRNA/rRNA methyltransferase